MARQPKTRQPKQKFTSSKTYTCGRCGRKINDYNLGTVKGKLTTVCAPNRPCPTPTV